MTTLCIKRYTQKEGGKPSDATKQQKPPQPTKHKKRQKHHWYSPWGETVKLALSDVDPALSTSLPASSSAVLLDDFNRVPSSAWTWCLWRWAIFPSSFGSSAFFESIVFSGFLICDGHRNLISTDDLQDVLNYFVLIDEPDNPRLGSLCFYLFLGTFPLLPCLPMWLGQHGIFDVFPRPTWPVEDKQFLETPSMVARSEVPQMIF